MSFFNARETCWILPRQRYSNQWQLRKKLRSQGYSKISQSSFPVQEKRFSQFLMRLEKENGLHILWLDLFALTLVIGNLSRRLITVPQHHLHTVCLSYVDAYPFVSVKNLIRICSVPVNDKNCKIFKLLILSPHKFVVAMQPQKLTCRIVN